MLIDSRQGRCSRCPRPFGRAWCAATREGVVQQLLNDMKFASVRAGARMAARLLDDTLPNIPSDVVVVAVPTIRRHIRVRGYAHAELIAREFARRRGLQYRQVLRRATQTVQHFSSKRERERQAKVAFAADSCQPVPYLLIDDIYTTGATAKYAAKALQDAGASEVWLAVVARQTLAK